MENFLETFYIPPDANQGGTKALSGGGPGPTLARALTRTVGAKHTNTINWS